MVFVCWGLPAPLGGGSFSFVGVNPGGGRAVGSKPSLRGDIGV